VRKIYTDYAATTPTDPRVLEAMEPFFSEVYGNASSMNAFGLEARKAIEDARNVVSGFMNTEHEELIFTGSATEANNLILKGFAFKKGMQKVHIAVSTIEHDSVLNTVDWLERQGVKISQIPVDEYGLLKMGALMDALKSGVSLVSVIHANNEVGTVQPISEIGKICHEHGAYLHTDAAQSFGKIPIDVKQMNIDYMTVNAHKIYGPKGVGALFLSKGAAAVDPLVHGGGHEFGLRSGTENTPGIVGFAKAVEIRRDEMVPESKRIDKLRNRLVEGALKIEDAYLNGHPTKRLPNIASLRFSYIDGESLLLLLNDEGIAATTGSACSSRSQEPSHVLLALGIKPEEARGSLRFSLGKYNNEEDVDYILDVLPKAVRKLREISPLGKNAY